MIIAKESGHWYHPDGRPCYEVESANGKGLRPTTLRDAHKFGLVPSVTTISRLLAAPGLDNWKQEQTIWAALTLPRHEGETDLEFVERVKFDSRERAKKAAERGTALHTDIERAIQNKDHDHQAHVKAIEIAMMDAGMLLRDGAAEHCFAHEIGYGGKIDWHEGNDFVDFKSKDIIEDGKRMAYDEHVMQLAACAHGVGVKVPRCFNLFVGIDDCKTLLYEWSAEEVARGLRMFLLLLAIWKVKNKIA